MYIALSLVFLLLAITVHEYGHARAMRKHGVEIELMGIGLGERFAFKIFSKHLGCPIYISPILLGAYVKPSLAGTKKLNELPYRSQAEIYGAGIVMNIALFGILTIIDLIITAILSDLVISRKSIAIMAISVIIPLIIVIFRRVFSSYIAVIAGFLIAGYLVFSINSYVNPSSTLNNSSSPSDYLESTNQSQDSQSFSPTEANQEWFSQHHVYQMKRSELIHLINQVVDDGPEGINMSQDSWTSLTEDLMAYRSSKYPSRFSIWVRQARNVSDYNLFDSPNALRWMQEHHVDDMSREELYNLGGSALATRPSELNEDEWLDVTWVAFYMYSARYGDEPPPKRQVSPVGGPIAIVELLGKSSSLEDSIIFALNLTLGLALINLIPLSILDGGRIFDALLRLKSDKLANTWLRVSTLVFVSFIAFVLFSDILGLFNYNLLD